MKFVRLTPASNGRPSAVITECWVNLDLVTSIDRRDEVGENYARLRITRLHMEHGYIDVQETPEDVLRIGGVS